MNITLKPKQQQLIQQQIEIGNFQTIDEVLNEALRLLDEKQRLRDEKRWEETRQKIALGTEQLRRGEGIDGEQVISRLREKGRKLREVKA